MLKHFSYILFVVTACAGTDTDVGAAAEEAVDSAVTGQAEAALLVTVTEDALAASSAEAAAAIAARAPLTLEPPGCATTTTAGATTTIVFDGCTGSRGLAALDGTLVIVVTGVTPNSLSFTATSDDLQVNGATLDVDVTATYRVDGANSTIEVTSSSSGSGPLGRSISHAGTYDVTWNASCATVDGTWASAADTASRSFTVALEVCSDACPIGSVSRTGVRGGTLAIEFDGSATAKWSLSSRGDAGTINLACAP